MLGVVLGLLTLFVTDEGPSAAQTPPSPPPGDRRACFLAAYPGVVCATSDSAITLCPTGRFAAPGARLAWDDGKGDKPFAELLAAPDLEDTVAMRYRPGRVFDIPPLNFEPGRIRNQAFFEAMYGDSQKAVAARTEKVEWMPRSGGKPVRVTSVNGVAAALRRVSDDLERELPADLKALVAKTAGVFVWRSVRGTNRRSPHSYAIAIDVGVARSDYWDWNKPDARGRYPYKNRFPIEVAEIFERHGFVWGGKWYHFDTMHFEYRPELLSVPCVDGPSPLRTLGGRDLTP